MWFNTTVVNNVPTIAAESSDVTSESEMKDLSNDQDSFEVDYYKTNKNERYYVQDPTKNVMMVIISN